MSSDPKKSNNPAITWDGEKETIDWHHSSVDHSNLYWALIELVCTNDSRYWAESGKGPGQADYGKAKPVVVSCTLDGVPVRLSHVVERLMDDFDRHVKIEGAALIRGRFQKIEDMLTRLRRGIESEFPDLDLNREDEY